jgi:dipeptidyl aminopeptidase/acylaminoacyl peptidase
MARPFRDADFAVLMPALRGENGLPGEFTLFFGEVDDALAAADVLRNLPYVRADRVYIAGHSAGATLAVLATLDSNRFWALASFSASLDISTLVQSYPNLAPFNPQDPEELRIRSASAFATDLRRPAQLFCGQSERRCRIESEQFARSAGPDVRAVSVPGDHFTAVPAEIEQAISFFRASAE